MVHECLTDGGIDPSDIDMVMSAFKAKSGKSSQDSSREIKLPQRYVFARANQSTNHLVDRGANGGLAGADMRILQKPTGKINIVGNDDRELTGLDVVTAHALFDTHKGPVIGILHEYTHLGKGRSIHAAGQMEWFTCKVDDRSKVAGFAQRIETPDGYVFPLSIESGLVYMHSIQFPTDDDLQQYPHVFFTPPDTWDASVLDYGITPALLEEIQQEADDSLLKDSMVDRFGDHEHEWYITWVFSWIQSLQRLGSILSCSSSPEQSC